MTDRPTLEDLDTAPESAHWCCNGNAEDCALCTDPNPPYPFLCPGHPRTTANERIVGEATEATELDPVSGESVGTGWRRRLARVPVWAMALVIAVVVVTVCLGMPFLVHWLWPGLDDGVLAVGNLFLGVILGGAGVMGFLVWRWEVRR